MVIENLFQGEDSMNEIEVKESVSSPTNQQSEMRTKSCAFLSKAVRSDDAIQEYRWRQYVDKCLAEAEDGNGGGGRDDGENIQAALPADARVDAGGERGGHFAGAVCRVVVLKGEKMEYLKAR